MYMQVEEALRRAAQPTADAIARREKGASRPVREVLAEIRRHFYDPGFTVKKLRENLRIRSWTQMAFAREIGLPVGRFIHHCRMQTAARLLSDTLYPIADIAFLVGYNGKSAFVKAFRRWCGLRPTSYRVRARKLRTAPLSPPRETLRPTPLDPPRGTVYSILLAEEIFTWSFWQRCQAAEMEIARVLELVAYLKLLRKLP